MYARVYPRQHHKQVVSLQDWLPHEEFEVYGPGTKPKGLYWCPRTTELPFLLPGHLYMFKTGDGWRVRQFWSEVIAYELSKLCGVDVPPTFVCTEATGPLTGALSEFFIGYEDERAEARLVHGSDLIRRPSESYDEKNGRPHTIRNNVRICRALGVVNAPFTWGAMLAFDALIGNTDRHPENWGLLWYVKSGRDRYRLAPVYDNGTSLGYEKDEAQVIADCTPTRLGRYVDRGTHHVQLRTTDRGGGGHLEVCAAFLEEFPEAATAMRSVVNFPLAEVRELLHWCEGFDVAPRFSRERSEFVYRLIEMRKERLERVVGGGTP